MTWLGDRGHRARGRPWGGPSSSGTSRRTLWTPTGRRGRGRVGRQPLQAEGSGLGRDHPADLELELAAPELREELCLQGQPSRPGAPLRQSETNLVRRRLDAEKLTL